MKDFARLWRVEGIGQILAVTNENDDGDPIVQIRVPDQGDLILTADLAFVGEDYDVAAGHAQAFPEGMTEAQAIEAVTPLLRGAAEFQGVAQ